MSRQIPPRLWAAFCVLALAFLSSVAPVQAGDGWTLADLNPFASKASTTKKPPTRKVSESKSSSWSLNPFAKKSAPASSVKNTTSRRKSEPSTLTKTWESLTPWEEHPAKKPAPLVAPRATKSGEKGWFDSWFGPEEPPHKPRTVNEWLDQEKPGF